MEQLAVSLTVLLIGVAVFFLLRGFCLAIFIDSRHQQQVIFLLINLGMLLLIWFGSYTHIRMMMIGDAHFDWAGFLQINLILGFPFMTNAYTVMSLLPSKR